MNRRQRLNLQKKKTRESSRKKNATTSKKPPTTEPGTDCQTCERLAECFEQRGRCRSYTNYEETKERVREEIERINRTERKRPS